MKHTEASIRREVSAANAQSKQRQSEVGLEYERRSNGHYVGIKYRANGFIHATLDGLSASEAHTAVRMFRIMMEVL